MSNPPNKSGSGSDERKKRTRQKKPAVAPSSTDSKASAGSSNEKKTEKENQSSGPEPNSKETKNRSKTKLEQNSKSVRPKGEKTIEAGTSNSKSKSKKNLNANTKSTSKTLSKKKGSDKTAKATGNPKRHEKPKSSFGKERQSNLELEQGLDQIFSKSIKSGTRNSKGKHRRDNGEKMIPELKSSQEVEICNLAVSPLSHIDTISGFKPLVLKQPSNLYVDLHQHLEFHCNSCPVESNGYESATSHRMEFDHNNVSVYHNTVNETIKCLSCDEVDLNLLNAVLLYPAEISICCKSCLDNSGYDPLNYSFSSNSNFLRYVDNMYRLNSLRCSKCDSIDNLAINSDRISFCETCIRSDKNLKLSDFNKRNSPDFLEKLFQDSSYSEFNNIINLIKAPTANQQSGIKEQKNQTNSKSVQTTSTSPKLETKDAKDYSKKNKKENNANKLGKNVRKMNGGKAMQQSLSTTTSKAPSNIGAVRKSPEPTVKNDLLAGLTTDELKVEDKFSKLRKIVANTLPNDIKLSFDDINEYYNYLTYSLFLEELYAVDLCSEVELDWINSESCVMTGSTKTWFDMYVNDDVHHLKKHPFTRDQPIFIIRKSDINLDWTSPPEFWAAYVSGSSLAKVDRKGRKIKARPKKHAVQKKSNQVSSFDLKLYQWNRTKFPLKEKGKNFAFLPASNVLGRIMNSMNKIENKDFINLILGKTPIKKIKFHNNIGKYFNQLNDSQKEALQSSFNNNVTILQGPPGSGKTSTIYEIILQLLENLHYYPILVVAASNLAVDNIAEKMLPQYKDIVLRITSLSKEREYNEDHPLGSVCLHNKVSNILPPNLQDIERRLKRNSSSVSSSEFNKYLDACNRYGSQLVSQANIIFATTAGIAGPYLKNVKNMPVIIMDEATQSSEPSTLIPLGANGCKKIILVGDTAQLSVFTRVKSLEMSLFQRVLENGTVKEPSMLDTQYRMHPDISEFSREKFYGSRLKDGITADDRKMKSIQYPVFFLDHKGIGALESKMFSVSGEEFGFSWVNFKEVNYIERMVEKLIVDHKVSPSKIGIMTGYAAQRDLIVKALEKNLIINPYHMKTNKSVDKEDLSEKKNVTVCNINGIIIATIDAFQGREMDFVILSCVRSNNNNNIGFMSDKRRMNVALTRAKYSFIICGNAKCLSSNDLWKQYIDSLSAKNYVKNSVNDY